MFYDVSFLLVLTNRTELRAEVTVEATSGDDAAKAAPAALHHTAVFKEHKNRVARELIVGVHPAPVTPEADPPLTNMVAAAIEGAEATVGLAQETPKPLNKPTPKPKAK